ncbi:MAG: hypothetical protein WC943_06615, partial [Elusimicrobiota bacterium]
MTMLALSVLIALSGPSAVPAQDISTEGFKSPSGSGGGEAASAPSSLPAEVVIKAEDSGSRVSVVKPPLNIEVDA